MTKVTLTAAACGILLWAGMARAAATAQETCDANRVTAWKVYVSCIDNVVAKDAKTGPIFDEFVAFAKCRHTYFKNWAAYQTRKSLLTSTCHQSRFTDNADGTVTDNLTGLTWDTKTDDASIHDESNTYTWSTGTDNEDGTVFIDFLANMNDGAGFAGANGWRVPTLAELQTIVMDFTCSGTHSGSKCNCGTSPPCIDSTFGTTPDDTYFWSNTAHVLSVGTTSYAWAVSFLSGVVKSSLKTTLYHARGVRGGL